MLVALGLKSRAKEVNHAYLEVSGIHVPLKGDVVYLPRVELVNPVEGVNLPFPFHGDNFPHDNYLYNAVICQSRANRPYCCFRTEGRRESAPIVGSVVAHKTSPPSCIKFLELAIEGLQILLGLAYLDSQLANFLVSFFAQELLVRLKGNIPHIFGLDDLSESSEKLAQFTRLCLQ